MRKYTLVTAAVLVLFGSTAFALADEKADKAIQELDKSFAKVKSYTAKAESITDVSFGPEYAQKGKMHSTSQWMRKGENVLMRSETKCENTTTQGGKTETKPSTITTADDGKFMYVLTVDSNMKTCMKSKSLTYKSQCPSGYFANFKTHYEIKLADDQKVDGHDCYVFEMKMKPMEGAPPSGKQMVCYQKDNGIMLKSESFDAAGKTIASTIVKDLKINADVDPKQFTFEVPEGVQVIDATATP